MAGPIAEAFVRLRPDLTGFRTQLETQLRTQIQGANVPKIRVPVEVEAATQQGTQTAQDAAKLAKEGAAAQAAAATASAGASATRTRALSEEERAARLVTTSLDKLAAAEARIIAVDKAGAFATSEVARARAQARAAVAAEEGLRRNALVILAAEDAEIKKLLVNLEAEAAAKVQATAETLRLAEARAADAAAASRESTATARDAAVQSARFKALAGGAGAAALSFSGLRGAVLAARPAFLAGTVAIIATFKSLQAFAGLEETLNTFQAVTGATAEEMDKVGAASQALGHDLTLPGVSAADAASAMLELSKAGLSVQDSIAGARGVLQLATAAGIENAQATELVANALNSFALAGEDATQVADAFANAANLSQGSIVDVGQAFAQTAAVANQTGVSFEDTTALLTLLAQAGLRGSDAGTSLRTALLRLAAPTQEARDLIKSLGLEVRNAQGEIRPEVFADFARATENLAPDVRDAIAAAVFGQDAIRAALIAGKQGLGGLREAQAGVAKQGTAAEVADAKNKGLSGSLRAVGNEAENLALDLGGKLTPAAKAFLEVWEHVFIAFDQIVKNDFGRRAAEQFDDLRRQSEDLDAASRGGATGFEFFGTAARQATEKAERLSKTLSGTLDELAALEAAGRDSGTAFDALVEDVDKTIQKLEDLGPAGLQALQALGPKLAPVIGKSLRDLAGEFTGLDLGGDAIPAALREKIRQAAELGPAGLAELRSLGSELEKAIAQGVEDDDSAVVAARKKVQEAIAAGQQQVRESIRSARGNLESLGSGLLQQIEQIFAAAPVTGAAKTLDDLRESLARLQEQTQRRQLRFDLGQAQRELRDAREALTLAPGQRVTAQQRQSFNEILAPFQERVKDAQASLKEFTLQDQIDDQEKLQKAAADAADKGLQKVVLAFEHGDVNAQEFTQTVNTLLKPALDALPKANLGLFVKEGFKRDIATLVQQAKELAGFIGTPGTTPGPQAVSPATAQAQANRNVADARANLQQQLTKQTTATDNNTTQLRLLRQAIADAVAGGSGKKKTVTGTGIR